MVKQFIKQFIAVAVGLLFLIAMGVVFPLSALAGIVARIGTSYLRTAQRRLGFGSNT